MPANPNLTDPSKGQMIGAGVGAAAGVLASSIPGMQQFAPVLIPGGAAMGKELGGMEARAKNLAAEADYFAKIAQADRDYMMEQDQLDRDNAWLQYEESKDRWKEAQLTNLTPNKGHYNMPWGMK